jgi:hypothetical protein
VLDEGKAVAFLLTFFRAYDHRPFGYQMSSAFLSSDEFGIIRDDMTRQLISGEINNFT